MSKVALDKLAPDNSEDYFHDGQRRIGHGTSVACVAGGTTLGVASNADLYLIKWKAAQKRNNGSYGPIQSRRVALIDAFNHIRAQILRANPSLKGKAVVDVSFGTYPRDPGSTGLVSSYLTFIQVSKETSPFLMTSKPTLRRSSKTWRNLAVSSSWLPGTLLNPRRRTD